jgi:hypothetical protein
MPGKSRPHAGHTYMMSGRTRFVASGSIIAIRWNEPSEGFDHAAMMGAGVEQNFVATKSVIRAP